MNSKLRLVPAPTDIASLARRLAAELPVLERDAETIRTTHAFRKLARAMGYTLPREEHFAKMLARGGLDLLPEITSYLRRYPECIGTKK